MVFQLQLHRNGSPGAPSSEQRGCEAEDLPGVPGAGLPGTPSAARRLGLMHTHTSAVLAIFNRFALIWQVFSSLLFFLLFLKVNKAKQEGIAQ